jgi:hypothetical protein
MRAWRLVSSGLLLWTGSTLPAQAQELRYLGLGSPTTGWIELAPGLATEITVGADIPGWGRVAAISESHLVLQWPVSDADQQRLRSQGMAAYDMLELHIPRVDVGTPPLPAPP